MLSLFEVRTQRVSRTLALSIAAAVALGLLWAALCAAFPGTVVTPPAWVVLVLTAVVATFLIGMRRRFARTTSMYETAFDRHAAFTLDMDALGLADTPPFRFPDGKPVWDALNARADVVRRDFDAFSALVEFARNAPAKVIHPLSDDYAGRARTLTELSERVDAGLLVVGESTVYLSDEGWEDTLRTDVIDTLRQLYIIAGEYISDDGTVDTSTFFSRLDLDAADALRSEARERADELDSAHEAVTAEMLPDVLSQILADRDFAVSTVAALLKESPAIESDALRDRSRRLMSAYRDGDQPVMSRLDADDAVLPVAYLYALNNRTTFNRLS